MATRSCRHKAASSTYEGNLLPSATSSASGTSKGIQGPENLGTRAVLLSLGPSLPIHPSLSSLVFLVHSHFECHWSDCKPCNNRSALFWPRHGASADFEMYTYPVQRKQIRGHPGRWTQITLREDGPGLAIYRQRNDTSILAPSGTLPQVPRLWMPSHRRIAASIRKLRRILSQKRSAGYEMMTPRMICYVLLKAMDGYGGSIRSWKSQNASGIHVQARSRSEVTSKTSVSSHLTRMINPRISTKAF